MIDYTKPTKIDYVKRPKINDKGVRVLRKGESVTLTATGCK